MGRTNHSPRPNDTQSLWDLTRKRIEHFTWAWFTTNMATGSLAVVLYQTPHQFSGLRTIGKVVFIVDLVLFGAFCCAMLFRFVIRPKALGQSLHHPTESFYFGTFWVSVALILINTAQYASEDCGLWLYRTLDVCFWCYGAASLLVAIFQYYALFAKEDLKISEMLPAWILPIYPLLVAGPLAGTLLEYRPVGAESAIWVGGVAFQGLGWMVATFFYVMWTFRLLSYNLPTPSMRPGMYIAVGPTGYTSQALILLGSQAPKVLPTTFLNVTSIPAGETIKILGTTTGIFIWLLAFWYFCISTAAIFRGRAAISFNLSCWAYVFPNAGFTLATMQVAAALDSEGIKWTTSAMTILLFLVWVLVGVLHVRALWRRKVLWPGQDEDV